MRVMPDTNVLLAAFAARGLCEAVYQVCLEQHEIFLSRNILDELKTHLAGKFKVSAGQAREIVAFVINHAQVVKPAAVDLENFPDKDDLPVLGTALAGGADVLITGDKELLKLKTFQGCVILTPRQFYEKVS